MMPVAILVALAAAAVVIALSLLARSIEKMARSQSLGGGLEAQVRERTQALEEQARKARELAERSEELARHRYREQAKGRALAAFTAEGELDQVVGAALGEMAAPLRAAVMVCYRLDGAELVPVAGYAASEATLKNPVPLGGMAQQALRHGRIETLEGLPDELELRFDVLLAAGRPRFLALVPLRVGNRSTGLLAVGAVAPLPDDALAMASDLAAPLALTMGRHALLEHTERIARELAHRNEELRTQAEALQAQGEELKVQQRELSLKNREVQKADQLKSEFLANMSHELRTPLNAVIGFSELLLEDGATLSELQRQWVRDIQGSGKHLLMLINRVLDLAKIEAGRTTFQLEALAPADAVESACALVRPTARKRNIVLGVVEHEARPVLADRSHIHQVLINLVSNAVKFSPDDAAVEVGFVEEKEMVRFWVKDQGPGIDGPTQARLFQPFFQAESPLVKKHEGTGLGLAIARKLVEAQGGQIGLSSAPGQGTTFYFTLPVAPEAKALSIPENPVRVER
jgi:signal transduction histidine kinase